ncbi:si:zfos-588f8.1 isoform X3 [Engraulis encrasicolus]|uniref:si:zfos-588f8.1 isoform X3 n=1 Tax=Engraulis encrasicolus TaxID=184585 RepID=UPI002FD4C3CF
MSLAVDAGGNGNGPAARHDGRHYVLQVYPRLADASDDCCHVKVTKDATAATVIQEVLATLGLDGAKSYVLAEVKECGGEEWMLEATDLPVHRVLLWPRKAQDQHPQSEGFFFLLQERNRDGTVRYVHLTALSKEREAQRMVARGFLPPPSKDLDDLCNLPSLNEDTILENLRNRFRKKKIYTYAGSILIAINPFKFLPIYNPKYVKMYENHQLGKLEPHIFAIADVTYYAMLRKRVNQCIVISGESGSGKTQSTNFLIHCLTALSQKGYASGVERTILGAGPVLEAFGNAKTAHNNNSSRFGKFIQVNYLENGVVRGAVVEKYLLEKSRLVSREKNERNYHVFYYLLVGASEEERKEFKLLQPEDYLYLKQQNFMIEDEEDLRHDFERLQQAMEMVGFLPATKKQIFSVLSAILYLGNVTYQRKANGRDEGLDVGPPEVLSTLSDLLKVKEELLVEALTKRKTVTVNDKLILPYSHSEAITARDSMAKSLYSALFDWIVLRINHALLNKKDMEESVPCLSIGVLDIFGFEDFPNNSFEQFCINYANEQLQYYFNQHIFKLEQEEYQAEGITWHNIDYTDNVGCIHLISKKPTGLLQLLDEESNFPHATDKTLLAKFKQQHQSNKYFVATPVMEPAFVIRHFAGNVKYQIKDFREKNTDHMRPDIVALLRSSDRAYVRQLIGMDPIAMFRWGILRATIRGLAAFNEAGRRWAAKTAGVARPSSRTPLGELQRANTPVERMYRDMHAQIISSIKDLQLDGEDPRKLLQSWGRLRFPRHVLQKNKNAKQKQLIPKVLLDSRSLKFIVSLTLHDRTTKSLMHLHKKKKPPSISAQFQTSCTKLLETLGRAEPFFIRCIRSNAEKREMCLDESLVLQQLRYTGMLETVRIRRSGYGAKYTFQEFLEHFRVLLPRTATACQEDIAALLQKMGLDNTTYQIGKTKVFLKELERQLLQDTLHKEVMRKIIFLQRWFRSKLERRHFQQMRQATQLLQKWWRRHREKRCRAAILLQSHWRGCRQRAEYQRQWSAIQRMQSLVRGNSARRRYQTLKEEKRKREEEEVRRREEEEARRREEEEARRRAEEEEARRREEEEARRIQEEEEEAKRKEEEDAKRRVEEEAEAKRIEETTRLAAEAERARREEEEAARSSKEEEEDKPVLKKEQQAAPQSPEAVAPERPPDKSTNEEKKPGDAIQSKPAVQASSAEESKGKETKGEGRPLIQESSEERKAPGDPHAPAKNGTRVEAVPEPELNATAQPQDNDDDKATPALTIDHKEANKAVPAAPGKKQEPVAPQPAAASGSGSASAKTSKAAPPQQQQAGKAQVSRNQEKRELRRQRGLEHSQRELQRAASASKDDPSPRLKHQDSTGDTGKPKETPAITGDGKPKELPPNVGDTKPKDSPPSPGDAKPKEPPPENKELDQYQFVAWKDKGKAKEAKISSPALVRPSTLSLDIPGSRVQRNGHNEAPVSPPGGGSASLPGHSKRGGEQDRRKGKRDTSESTSPETQIPKSRKINAMRAQERDISLSLDDLSSYGSPTTEGPVSRLGRVRYHRKQRKRRLGFARGCLAVKSAEMEDMEYWNFPLPPMSPLPTPSPTSPKSTSPKPTSPKSPKSPKIPKSPKTLQVQRQSSMDSAGDGAKSRKSPESTGPPDMTHLPPSTPERSGFLRKILKKREKAQTPEDGDLTMAQTLTERSAEVAHPPHSSRSHYHHHHHHHQAEAAPGGRAVGRNPTIKISRATRVSEQWNASLDREITNANELRHLDEFLGNQVNDLRSRGKQLSATEDIFITATREFRETIKSMYSLSKPHIGYKQLMKNYQMKVMALAGEKQKAEVQLVVNLFQSVLDGFIRGEIKKEEAEPAKPTKTRKKRRKKDKSMESPLDHMFATYQVNIVQSCDQCTSYIWGMEKACMCSYCKMVCHKKCLSKITTDCSSFCAKKNDDELGQHNFGVRVGHLTNDKTPVPVVLEIMLEHVEMNGLYTEGIYRKSGSANRMKELYQKMESDPTSVCLDDYSTHIVTGLIKQWLRELPDPLMTFTYYNHFLRAVELPEKQEQLQAIYRVLDQLPMPHFSTLERLIFHLVRVSKEEVHNRMTPNSLAIVFAPCILRCPDTADPLMSMKDVAKTTTCVEMLIHEQIRRYNEKMDEIEQLEYAENLAVNQLKLKRNNTTWRLPLRYTSPVVRGPIREKASLSDLCVVPENEPIDSDTEAERSLVERIKSIKQEKDDLACRLPELDQPGSDQENLDSEASLSSESLLDVRSGTPTFTACPPSNTTNAAPSTLATTAAPNPSSSSSSSTTTTVPETEGGSAAVTVRKPRPLCPPKPTDVAQHHQQQRPKSFVAEGSWLSAVRQQIQRRNPIIPGTVRLPHGISSSTASVAAGSGPVSRHARFLTVVQRREHPGRRKDSIQSLYIAPGSELGTSPPSSSSASLPSPTNTATGGKAQRRFSDPDIPYIDDYSPAGEPHS